ncbi:conserved membrane hypothetical protein [uncultured Mycobacterium sp.]|uniref:Transmembrane protein n=1 Tax=uncultured Mycobacterium sp. TaxID=171292 RepID=A0A1Y5PJ51_9MYCO|nr:conserved membrane hypothetical protein [uncultured Mycobacterium sp.]
MPDNVHPDRFDDIRREWIAFRQGDSLIQRRRAEQLGRLVRKRQRIQTVAVPDTHDDTVLPRMLWRQAKSRVSKMEVVLVLVVAALFPVGWPAGWALRSGITGLIPETLRGYPIAALVWSGVGLGVVTLLVYQLVYDPAGSFGQIVVLPWLSVQLSAIPFVAGVYGILEGWLAVDGSDQWWPLTPVREPLTAQDAAAILGAYDVTPPAVVEVKPVNESGYRTRPW